MQKGLFFLLFYLPLQVALNISSGIDLASGRVLIIIFFFILLFEMLREGKFFWKIKLLDFFLAGFLFSMFFSIVFSQELSWSFRKLLFLLSLLPIYFLVRSLIRDEKSLISFLKWIVRGASLVAFLGLVQFISQFVWGIDTVYSFWSTKILPIFSGNSLARAVLANPAWLVNISGKTLLRASSLFPDPHMLAFYLNLSLGANIALLVKPGKKNFVWLLSLALIFLVSCLTFSRGGYLGVLGGGFFLIGYLFIRANFFKKIVMATILGVAILMLFNFGWISDRFSSSFSLREGSNLGRIETWKKSLNVLESHLLFGVGIGNYPLYVKANADYREPIYAHSNYLDIALDGGILALSFWLAFLFYGIVSFYRLSFNNPLFLGLIFGVVSFAIHSLFETSIYSTSVLPLFLAIISLANWENLNKNA